MRRRTRRSPGSSTIESIDKIVDWHSPTVSNPFERFAEFVAIIGMNADEAAIRHGELLPLGGNHRTCE